MMDEVQYAVSRSLVKVKIEGSAEEYQAYLAAAEAYKKASPEEQEGMEKPSYAAEARLEAFMEQHKEMGQFSDIGHLDDGRVYVALPSIVSKSILEGIGLAVKEHNFKANLGMGWIVGSDWSKCH